LCHEKKYGKSETSLRKVTILQMWGTTWVKEDKMTNVGPFIGNPGVKQILSDPTKM
jgi:hypothetical protein